MQTFFPFSLFFPLKAAEIEVGFYPSSLSLPRIALSCPNIYIYIENDLIQGWGLLTGNPIYIPWEERLNLVVLILAFFSSFTCFLPH